MMNDILPKMLSSKKYSVYNLPSSATVPVVMDYTSNNDCSQLYSLRPNLPRAPKKKICARFAAEELSSKTTTSLSSPPLSVMSKPQVKLTRFVSWNSEEDIVSVVSNEEEVSSLSGNISGDSEDDDDSSWNESLMQSPPKKKRRTTATGGVARVTPEKRIRTPSTELKLTTAAASKEEHWMAMLGELVAYKKDHKGSTQVSQHARGEYRRLGAWVKTQRRQYFRNRLSERRVKLLESIGFVWRADSSNWINMYQRLLEYKAQHNGSTQVPFQYDADRPLGRWVSYNRHHCKNPDKIRLLDAIGFNWEVVPRPRMKKGSNKRKEQN